MKQLLKISLPPKPDFSDKGGPEIQKVLTPLLTGGRCAAADVRVELIVRPAHLLRHLLFPQGKTSIMQDLLA